MGYSEGSLVGTPPAVMINATRIKPRRVMILSRANLRASDLISSLPKIEESGKCAPELCLSIRPHAHKVESGDDDEEDGYPHCDVDACGARPVVEDEGGGDDLGWEGCVRDADVS